MDYPTKTRLILPFKGAWIVSNGGQDPEKNSHNRLDGPKNQLYAYDFRKPSHGDEETLKDFPSFGEEVIAPADGVITQVIDGSIDVSPGERDRSVGVGNAIIIDHQNGEWSLLCHFKYQSIGVKVGDQVKQGEVLGLCGNTGNTSQPHIHFNLQDGPLMHKAEGLPVQFREIKVNGEIKNNFEATRGDEISNP